MCIRVREQMRHGVAEQCSETNDYDCAQYAGYRGTFLLSSRGSVNTELCFPYFTFTLSARYDVRFFDI
jgi:hypothetical protein